VGEICASADGRAARNEADTVSETDLANGISVFIDEGEARSGAIFESAQAKAKENALFNPNVDPPTGGSGGIGGGGPDFASLESRTKVQKGFKSIGVAYGSDTRGKVAFNERLEL
jgi:hypothetical protein